MKVFVVLGMHRSATSLIAKGLHDSGVHMGDRLMGAQPSNPQGHYEDLDVVALNDALLGSAGGTWSDPPSTHAVSALDDSRVVEYLQRRREAGHPMWGWKDPRTVLTWGLFAPHLTDVDLHLVFATRGVDEIARSLDLRETGGADPTKWHALIGEYHRRLREIARTAMP